MAAAAAAAAAVLLLPNSFPKPSASTVKYQIPHSTVFLSINPLRTHKRLPFRPFSAVQDTVVVEEKTIADADVDADVEKKRKLYVANLPWSHTAEEIEKLFGECGTVKKVEIIKQNNGLSRGFAFVVMGSGEEAQAVIDKFHSYELLGRSLKVEFAKSFRKPSPATLRVVEVETRHKIYVSNLAWKVRSTNLREFFSSKFKPVSARVIFDDRRSAGYGFVSFATEEEAVAAFTELDGQENKTEAEKLGKDENAHTFMHKACVLADYYACAYSHIACAVAVDNAHAFTSITCAFYVPAVILSVCMVPPVAGELRQLSRFLGQLSRFLPIKSTPGQQRNHLRIILGSAIF